MLLSALLGIMAGGVLPAPVFAADPCPNAQYRTGPSARLPDCRAYELVTPAFKNGAPPLFEPPILDGSHVLFSSLGGFGDPAANPSEQGASYIAARTPAGWLSTPLEPPESELFNAAQLLTPLYDLSADFTKAVLIENPASSLPETLNDHRLYLRQPDGSFVEVGPIVPPAAVAASISDPGPQPQYSYQGASQDLSHVFFSVASICEEGVCPIRYYWPQDTTISPFEQYTPSLYEYVGSGHTGEGADVPSLVGVDNAGNLISQCGTVLGSGGPNGSSYNAISSDGSSVFFTAHGIDESCEHLGPAIAPPANELFARIDRSRTTAVSEPSRTDCEACDTSTPRDANFQGASRDGSKVFFLTDQALLPGQTGTNLYEYDFNGPTASPQHPDGKISLVSGGSVSPEVQGVARVAQDGSRVYFVANAMLTTQPDVYGRQAQAGLPNLYVYDAVSQHLTFIATLSTSDESDWASTDERPVEATPDGRFLLLASRNDLTPDASGSGRQLYRYDAQTTDLVRVTIGEDGFNNNGNSADFYFSAGSAFVPSRGAAVNARPSAAPQGGSISDDGAYVFFLSSAALTPDSIDDSLAAQGNEEISNIYEYHEGHVYLISDGQDRHRVASEGAVRLLGTSSSGSDVYFTTADSLVSQDSDGQRDVYDARIDGGFPAPGPAAGCTGDACQGAPSVVQSFGAASSATLTGSGNLTAAPVKTAGPKQRIKKRVKCSKSKKKPARSKCVKTRRHGSTTKANTHKEGKR